MSAYVSQGKRVEADYEMNDNNNAYQKQEKARKMQGLVESVENSSVAPACLVKVGGGGRYWKSVRGLSVDITCGAGNGRNIP